MTDNKKIKKSKKLPLPEFLEYLKAKVKNQNTLKIYNVPINKLFEDAHERKISKKELLNNHDILIKLMNYQLNRTNRTYYKYCYHHMLRWLDLPKLIGDLDKIKEPKIQKPKKNIEFVKLKEFVYNLKNPQLKLVIMTQYDTALRSIDLLNLKIGDLIKHTDGRLKMNLVIEKTREEGTLFLSSDTTKMMYNWIDDKFKDKDRKDILNEKVFSLSYREYLRKLKKQSKKYLGREITTHWLRALRATHIVESGSGTKEVKKQLVVKEDETANRYVKLAGKETEDIIEPKW